MYTNNDNYYNFFQNCFFTDFLFCTRMYQKERGHVQYEVQKTIYSINFQSNINCVSFTNDFQLAIVQQ